jgi:hypothetical protein
MLLVALSAVAVYSYMRISERIAKLEDARASYVAKADSHAVFRKLFEMGLKNKPESGIRDWLSEQARYYGGLEKKYAKAASAPWTVVAPDPPRPPLVPTDEQLSKWKSSKTGAELLKEAEASTSHRSNSVIKPYMPRKLSGLKSP